MTGVSETVSAPQFDTARLLAAFHAKTGADPAGQSFIAQVGGAALPEELAGWTAADLGAVEADFWAWGGTWKGPVPAVRIVRAVGENGRDLGLDLLEVVQGDAPFLVDSVMGEMADAGLFVRAMVHPVVEVGGQPRSMIQVVLDPVGADREATIIDGVRASLADAHLAVDDFPAMLDLLTRCTEELERTHPSVETDEALEEDLAFLRWVKDGHFVLLGARQYQYPRTADGGYAAEEPLYQPQDSLGVLRDQSRAVLRRASEPAVLSPALRRSLERAEPLTVAKANLRSRVHRRAYMDYVGIRRYGDDGKPSGEVRFVGLFTAAAYDQPTAEVPLIRRKARHVMERADFASGGHNAMRLSNIVENYPRDELFQVGEDELLATALGILHLSDRPRVKLFARHDPFDRFVSVLLYIPRDRYDSGVRARAGQILAQAWNGRVSAYYPSFSDAPLARVHYIIGVEPGQHTEPDLAKVEADIAEATRTWEDRFDAAVREAGDEDVADTLARYAGAFPAGYKDQYGAAEALADIAVIDGMDGAPIAVRAYRQNAESKLRFRFKLYKPGEAAPLADVLPILEHMGLKALEESGFPIQPAEGADKVWVHEFIIQDEDGEHLVFDDIRRPFEQAFVAVWTGKAESDGFNRLVLELGIGWRDAALVRALAKYRQQSGLDLSQAVQERALADNPGLARLILDLFRTKFDPAVKADLEARQEQAKAVIGKIDDALQAVESLDADRSIRRLALLVGALKRTNFYQVAEDGGPKPYISFKIASRELEDLPAPKPFREIFVLAPHVEGVHLRFGPVARGGLRWSDRRDDFRTEVLGLVKAQQVKNAVIVPVGSKGGFYPKCLPRGGDRDAIQAEAIRAYKTFLFGLLDITDNLDSEGKVVHPAGVIVHDGDDPYLVVAADKGTATFSDIANGVAESYGFWLGDAFASGGSAGYDHKVMGITARGAWEAVKRHFREMGKDIQSEPFTVIGVGDMSGDVFGNGMLLSKQIRLLAAFDHRHVFLDPDPDPAKSWAERDRMFKLPRSSWDDYDRGLISKGGGVFARTLKEIPLSAEVKAMLGVKADAMAPTDLIHAILKSQAELLYLGGIGTYVKATSETNADAGDKANDATRVNGSELRVKVVGEGANLGLTQAGRIEFARNGGRINTDAIDNSAGVDSSDHEVNIKILTGMVERAGELDREARNKLLASMTDEVAEHVLAHNYGQTLALSMLEAEAVQDLDAQERFMESLEAKGKLDRRVEGLPTPAQVADRIAAGKGLTRPELAVVLAYGKLELFEEIIASRAPDDPWFLETLEAYFPKALGKYEDEMKRHRLRREIIATVLDNEMVNLCGPTFAPRLRAAAGCDTTALVVGFEAARQVLGFNGVWEEVEALDGQIPAAGQMALFRELSYLLRGQTFWLARKAGREGSSVEALVTAYGPGVEAMKALLPGMLSSYEQKAAAKRGEAYVKAGAPKTLAHAIALMRPLTTAADLVDLAGSSSWPVENVARLYHQVGAAFGFDKLRAAAGSNRAGDAFERLAVRRLVEDMLTEQTAVTKAIMAYAGGKQAGDDAEHAKSAIASWTALNPGPAKAAKRTIDEIEDAPGGWSFAKLTIANAALRELAAGK